jgi:hypothetical protein
VFACVSVTDVVNLRAFIMTEINKSNLIAVVISSERTLGLKLDTTKPNKLLIYKTVLKPIWTFEIQLWGTASAGNIEFLERFQ